MTITEPVAEPLTEDEEPVMRDHENVGQELREQVAKALGCDPRDLKPRR